MCIYCEETGVRLSIATSIQLLLFTKMTFIISHIILQQDQHFFNLKPISQSSQSTPSMALEAFHTMHTECQHLLYSTISRFLIGYLARLLPSLAPGTKRGTANRQIPPMMGKLASNRHAN